MYLRYFLMLSLCALALSCANQAPREIKPEKAHLDSSVILMRATTSAWTVEMAWDPASLVRKIRFKYSGHEFGEWFGIKLRQRGAPYQNQIAGVTMTRSGAHLPDGHVDVFGARWYTVVSHEPINFPSVRDFDTFLNWEYNRKVGQYALDLDGNLIMCDIHESKNGNCFNLDYYKVLISGKSPSKAFLQNYVKGEVYFKK